MWEEGINTKPQIYYNNNNAGTAQASKRKKKAIQIEKWKTHTQNKENNITKKKKKHIYISNNKEKIYTIEMKQTKKNIQPTQTY